MKNIKLPAGYISTEDAIKLIDKHTAKHPLVDLDFLMDNVSARRMREVGNFTIKLMSFNEETGKYESKLHVTAVMSDARDRENLKYAIVKKYESLSGKRIDLDKTGLRNLTTQVNDKKGNTEAIREQEDEAPDVKQESGKVKKA